VQTAAAPAFFTAGDVRFDDTSYQSGDLCVTITNVNKDGINYYVADCVMKDSNRFFSAFALDRYVLHKGERASAMAQRKGAVVAINGDYYGHADADRNDQGIVIRNGVTYRTSPWWDVAAIYRDGTMKTFDNTVGAEQLVADGANQVFSFGPMLMDGNGKALSAEELKKRHNANSPRNPRSGVGYIGPNHFVLVVVDGRGAGGSKGMTISEFADVFEGLGCQNAYNLDGGGSATMVFMGKVINHPCDASGERQVSDILYFGESETDQANISRLTTH
jgi:exopolysaccharide biosynthesis protein